MENKKKIGKTIMCAVIAVVMLFAVAGCSEATPKKSNAMATAIGIGHHNCITEATVIVDGYGDVLKVQIDDIFPVADVATFKDLSKTADKVDITISDKTATYYQYLHIGEKYFKVSSETGIYAQIGVTSGAIGDLVAYCKEEAGVNWYYDSFTKGKMSVCKIDAEKGVDVGGVKLSDDKAFNTSNGSMRKRYSKYWNVQSSLYGSNLGFNGNMDMLENYLITYGFEGSDVIVLPKDNGSKVNTINGITTGATLSADTGIYVGIAKKAYDKALDLRK